MATTPNFGWTTPNDTDYVKDGASAIRTLGNAIDASMADLEGGTTGQVLSKNSNTDMDFVWVTPNDADAIQNTIVDAKGDLITATGADVPARLGVGTDGQVLTADSTTATGLKWATAASGGMTLISSTSLSGASVSFSSIPSTYKKLWLLVSGWSSSSNATLRLQVNDISAGGSAYQFRLSAWNNNSGSSDYGDEGTSVFLSGTNLSNPSSSATMSTSVEFPNYTGTADNVKYMTIVGSFYDGTRHTTQFGAGQRNDNAAITKITIFPSAGNFDNGTAYLYGVN